MNSSKRGLNSRRGTGKKGECNPILGIFLCIILCAMTLLIVVGLVSQRKEGEDILSATSNMLGVSADELAAPWNSFIHYGKLKGDKAPGLVERPKDPIVIGYAISLIKCSDFQSSRAGLLDAAIVMRHSVHMTSVRNPSSGSAYDYKMFAIVHSKANAEGCGEPLKDAGYTVIVKDPPVKRDEIQGEFLRNHIAKEWCCGDDEFIKLYAYTIENVPVVVHVDMDYVFHKPMDDMFDAMLYSKDSRIGQKAREQIPLEFPKSTTWPAHVDAFMTRDWPQVIPGRKAAFQAGFLVVKPNPQVFGIIVDVIRKGDYVEGFGRDNGWGGQGYGGFVGAMAMQGLLAYVYDILLYDTWVELNQCRYNHMGMDVLYRAQPGFRKNHAKVSLNAIVSTVSRLQLLRIVTQVCLVSR
jgi:hypothetical protein